MASTYSTSTLARALALATSTSSSTIQLATSTRTQGTRHRIPERAVSKHMPSFAPDIWPAIFEASRINLRIALGEDEATEQTDETMALVCCDRSHP